MEAICKALKETSEYIFDWYSTANVREDSLTDWFLHNLKIRLPKQFYYHTFTRYEEGKIFGADFYLYILNDEECIALAVQAKKLTPTGNHYETINYKGGRQINLLISTAMEFNHKPVYFFYNNVEEKDMCFSLAKTGIFIKDAEVTRDLLRYTLGKNIQKKDILNGSIAFHCPFCCFSDGTSYNMDGLKQELLRQSTVGLIKIQNVPKYIFSVANGEFNENQFDFFGNNGIEPKAFANSVAVLDLRKRNNAL